jgi:hypothetical protein
MSSDTYTLASLTTHVGPVLWADNGYAVVLATPPMHLTRNGADEPPTSDATIHVYVPAEPVRDRGGSGGLSLGGGRRYRLLRVLTVHATAGPNPDPYEHNRPLVDYRGMIAAALDAAEPVVDAYEAMLATLRGGDGDGDGDAGGES